MKNSVLFLISFFILITSNSFSTPLNGTYTIGSGGDYITINSAVNDIVLNGVNGPVIFNIKSGIYEEKVIIDSIAGSSNINRITFQSQTGNKDDVLWREPSDTIIRLSLITLNSADNITFKNLSFLNVGYGVDNVFYLKLYCNGINIINNNIRNNIVYEGYRGGYGIYCDSAFTKNLIVKENNIEAARCITLYRCIKSIGIQILSNRIVGIEGITLHNQDSIQIEKNEIITGPRGLDIHIINKSILLSGCDKYINISKNIIFSNGTFHFSPGDGILIKNSICQNSFIVNNFIYYTGAFGLSVQNSSKINIYFNSIKTISFFPLLPALNLILSNCSECDVKNNIFGGRNSTFSNQYNPAISSDFNSFSPKELNGEEVFLFYYNEVGFNNLEEFIVASNNEYNSIVKDVLFVSPSNLHLFGSSIGDTNLIGVPIPGIIDDIDGNIRNPLYPYKGADEPDYPLPVELSAFNSTINLNNVNLFWTTTSEINNLGFVIERSVNNNDWFNMGFVQGHGTTTSINNYEFSDRGLNSGKYNYRLKQLDYNGNYEYFNSSEAVIIGSPVTFLLSQNYPNPFNPVTVINYELPSNNNVQLKVYDNSGKEMLTLVNGFKEAGVYNVTFDGSNFASGVYYYKLTTGNFTSVKKMFLVK